MATKPQDFTQKENLGSNSTQNTGNNRLNQQQSLTHLCKPLHHNCLEQYKNKIISVNNSLNILTYNSQGKGAQSMSDLLQLMSNLKLHIIALQDTGHIYATRESKRQYGDYQLITFQFGENKCDTLAFLIDEGIYQQVIKSPFVIKSNKARAMVIPVPKITGAGPLYIVNTYAPPKHSMKAEYVQHLMTLLDSNKITAQNSLIVGDLNDYLIPEIDRWSNRQHNNKHQRGAVLNPLRRKGFEDVFRIQHPEATVFTRVGLYKDTNNEKTKVVMTRIDHILSSLENAQKIDSIAILDNYNIGSDHRPVMCSLVSDIEIPHVAAINREVNTTKNVTEALPLPEQPKIKYVNNTHSEDKWPKFTETIQKKIIQNSVLMLSIQSSKHIKEWTTTFTQIAEEAIEQSLGWQTTVQNEKSKAFIDENSGLTEQPKPSTTLPYIIQPISKVGKQQTLRYQLKLQHIVYQKSNKARGQINKINSILVTCAKRYQTYEESHKASKTMKKHLSFLNTKIQDLDNCIQSYKIKHLEKSTCSTILLNLDQW